VLESADTLVDRESGEKRTLGLRRYFRECICRSDILRSRTIRSVAIVFVGGQDESCAAQAKINPLSQIVPCTIARLLQQVAHGLHIDRDLLYAWSDARVVLVWIRTMASI